MYKHHTLLLLTILFTLLFIALITLGSYLLSVHSRQWSMAIFLFAIAAVCGQISCLGLWLRERLRHQSRLSQTRNESSHDV